MCGFTAQLVEHRSGIAEVTGLNPVEALIFFKLLPSDRLNWKIDRDDHSSLTSTTAVQYEFHIYFTLFVFLARNDGEVKENCGGTLLTLIEVGLHLVTSDSSYRKISMAMQRKTKSFRLHHSVRAL